MNELIVTLVHLKKTDDGTEYPATVIFKYDTEFTYETLEQFLSQAFGPGKLVDGGRVGPPIHK